MPLDLRVSCRKGWHGLGQRHTAPWEEDEPVLQYKNEENENCTWPKTYKFIYETFLAWVCLGTGYKGNSMMNSDVQNSKTGQCSRKTRRTAGRTMWLFQTKTWCVFIQVSYSTWTLIRMRQDRRWRLNKNWHGCNVGLAEHHQGRYPQSGYVWVLTTFRQVPTRNSLLPSIKFDCLIKCFNIPA